MPRTKEQNEQIREQKRELILQEARTLFSHNGYSGTTIALVAKGAGVSFGSVFNHFPTKEELFQAAVLEPLEEMLPYYKNMDINHLSPLDQITNMIQEQIKAISKQGSYLRLIQYVLGQPQRFPHLFSELDVFLHQFEEDLVPLIVRGQECGELAKIDPYLVALSYLSFINGIRLTIVDSAEHPIWEKFGQQAIRLFGPLSNIK